MQAELLTTYPNAPLRVYAIWTEKLAGDRRGAWDGGGLTDHRVAHFWDGQDAAGRWFVDHLPTYRGRDWDAFLLFGPAATWTAVPAPLLGSGSTVIRAKDDLARSLEAVLAARPAGDYSPSNSASSAVSRNPNTLGVATTRSGVANVAIA